MLYFNIQLKFAIPVWGLVAKSLAICRLSLSFPLTFRNSDLTNKYPYPYYLWVLGCSLVGNAISPEAWPVSLHLEINWAPLLFSCWWPWASHCSPTTEPDIPGNMWFYPLLPFPTPLHLLWLQLLLLPLLRLRSDFYHHKENLMVDEVIVI